MVLLKEIGLEIEYWLEDLEGNILEAPVYNFPSDEMGFLIEIRSIWGSDPNMITATIRTELMAISKKAIDLGFRVTCEPYKVVSEEWQEYIAEKYKHAGMPDHTKNVYEFKISQHTGIRGNHATAGLHVHFSIWDTDKEDFLWLDPSKIKYIVHRMDQEFKDLIKETDRIPGEWEHKGIGTDSARPHGFEYRSLPATADIDSVAYLALKILNELDRPFL